MRQVLDMKGDSRTDKQKKITWSKQKLYEDMRVTPHPCQINNKKKMIMIILTEITTDIAM